MSVLLPENITFVEWTNQLRNTYPTQDVPLVSSEKDWRGFYNMLLLNRCFEDKFLPDSRMFSDWRNWAREFLLSTGE